MNKYFENNDEYSGHYQLISPEFPLKKDSNQSTNIDYLLVNSSKKILVFLELKTDIGSLDHEQIKIYTSYKKKINGSSAKFMWDDLNEISKASSIKSKYATILSSFRSHIQSPNDYKKALIIYLTPQAALHKISKITDIDFVLSFADLPQTIEHKFKEYWKVIHKHLIQLNTHFKTNITHSTALDPLIVITNNIHVYLFKFKSKVLPISVQIGNTGQGIHPNYQVEFEDGSVKTFRFNGEPHTVLKFNSAKLSNKILWKNIKCD